MATSPRRHTAPPAPFHSAQDVTIVPVRSTSDRDRFIRFQLELYRGDAYFVPPIVAERRDFLDPRKNPFWSHAQAELFLALRNGEVVGRVAAVVDANYNQFHNADAGFFGLFDSINDPSVAGGLLQHACAWLKSKGMKQLLGPVNVSFNHDCGVLVEGFDHPPAMMMPYNARYYGALLEQNGLRKHKDLFSYELSSAVAPPEKVVRVAEKVRERDGVRVRPIDIRNEKEETRRIKSIYNAMLDRAFGFVPMNEEEFDLVAARLRPLVQIRPELCFIAEVKDEPVAFCLTLPDTNAALRAAGGYLTKFGLPTGLLKLLWAARSINRVRVLLLGIKPGYRRRGLDALLFVETLKAARKLHYTVGELGWCPEDDQLINRAIESMGARRYKTYRIYERAL